MPTMYMAFLCTNHGVTNKWNSFAKCQNILIVTNQYNLPTGRFTFGIRSNIFNSFGQPIDTGQTYGYHSLKPVLNWHQINRFLKETKLHWYPLLSINKVSHLQQMESIYNLTKMFTIVVVYLLTTLNHLSTRTVPNSLMSIQKLLS